MNRRSTRVHRQPERLTYVAAEPVVDASASDTDAVPTSSTSGSPGQEAAHEHPGGTSTATESEQEEEEEVQPRPAKQPRREGAARRESAPGTASAAGRGTVARRNRAAGRGSAARSQGVPAPDTPSGLGAAQSGVRQARRAHDPASMPSAVALSAPAWPASAACCAPPDVVYPPFRCCIEQSLSCCSLERAGSGTVHAHT